MDVYFVPLRQAPKESYSYRETLELYQPESWLSLTKMHTDECRSTAMRYGGCEFNVDMIVLDFDLRCGHDKKLLQRHVQMFRIADRAYKILWCMFELAVRERPSIYSPKTSAVSIGSGASESASLSSEAAGVIQSEPSLAAVFRREGLYTVGFGLYSMRGGKAQGVRVGESARRSPWHQRGHRKEKCSDDADRHVSRPGLDFFSPFQGLFASPGRVASSSLSFLDT
jgi:hypothetical protein